MTKKIKFYIIATTGVFVLLSGLVNFFTSYGDTSFMGIFTQITSAIIVLGGFVNLMVASNIKKEIDFTEDHKPDAH